MLASKSDLRVDEKVHCRIVSDMIPISLCEVEQCETSCKYCTEKTRRCMRCNKACGIANAELGLCSKCVKRNSSLSADTEKEADILDCALPKVLERVRSIASADIPSEDTQGVMIPPAPSILRNLDELYAVLAEHGVKTNGVWRVKAPVTILIRRMHLLEHEALSVIHQLSNNALLKGVEPWQEVELLRVDGIEDAQEKLRNSQEQVSDQKRRKTKRSQNISGVCAAKKMKPSPVQIRKDEKPQTKKKPSAAHGAVTYTEIYTHLLERSHEVCGERLIGGSLPALQIRFKLNAEQAKDSLEWFRDKGHLQQKDGWRTVRLLSDSVDSTDSPLKQRQSDRSNRNSKTVTSSRSNELAIHGQSLACARAVASADVAVEATVKSLPTVALGTALQELEQVLPALRQQRDDLMLQVSQLEVAFLALKALHQQTEASQQEQADTSLAQAISVAQTLLDTLKNRS